MSFAIDVTPNVKEYSILNLTISADVIELFRFADFAIAPETNAPTLRLQL